MPRSHQEDQFKVKEEVPKEFFRSSQLFQAKGADKFISEHVNVLFPIWDINKISEITNDQFLELENELFTLAEKGKQKVADHY
ncbi:MAG: hypothetical protein WCO35_00760 [Candidatus Nomurabacteria bacterium]